jgi:hypothetical protein
MLEVINKALIWIRPLNGVQALCAVCELVSPPTDIICPPQINTPRFSSHQRMLAFSIRLFNLEVFST